MKKLFTLSLLVLGLTLTGCTEVDNTDVEDLQADVATLTTTVGTLGTDLDAAKVTLATAQASLEASEELIATLQTVNEELAAELALTNSKIKNALNRDEWATRKVKYNVNYSSYDGEYCFGIFDEDWTLETASEYTHNTGLKFVMTVEQIQWGTEVFAKDSCGNYSDFIFADSAFGLYSSPLDFFEVGETYEVVLYKEVYFNQAQMGFLPLSDMEAYGQYPADLSGIISTLLS